MRLTCPKRRLCATRYLRPCQTVTPAAMRVSRVDRNCPPVACPSRMQVGPFGSLEGKRCEESSQVDQPVLFEVVQQQVTLSGPVRICIGYQPAAFRRQAGMAVAPGIKDSCPNRYRRFLTNVDQVITIAVLWSSSPNDQTMRIAPTVVRNHAAIKHKSEMSIAACNIQT